MLGSQKATSPAQIPMLDGEDDRFAYQLVLAGLHWILLVKYCGWTKSISHL